jgi:signal transduction histidine kinase
VQISDAGAGIDADTLAGVFDPFFTTKVVGQGSGPGLSISYGIIQNHGGHIFADSELGKRLEFFCLAADQTVSHLNRNGHINEFDGQQAPHYAGRR